MDKVCFVCMSGLPVPAVKGGAVETLLQILIEENELRHELECTVLMCCDNSVKNVSYRHTNLVAFKGCRTVNRVCASLTHVVNAVFGTKYRYDSLEKKQAVKYLLNRQNEFDLIIDENGLDEIWLANGKLDSSKTAFHMHGISDNDLRRSGCIRNVISVSDYCKSEWLKTKPDDNVIVVRNCIDTDAFSREISAEEKTDLKAKYQISHEDFVIFFAGRIVPEKGVKELIEAVTRINDPRIVLLIAGSPYFADKSGKTSPYMEELRTIAEKTRARVIFAGYIGNQDLPKYHGIADAAVVPSKWDEPAGLVVLEGQAAGTPLIVTNSGGIPEYFCGEAGIMVERNPDLSENLRSAILRLMNDTRRDAMGARGKQFAKRFSRTNYYAGMIDAMRSLMAMSHSGCAGQKHALEPSNGQREEK